MDLPKAFLFCAIIIVCEGSKKENLPFEINNSPVKSCNTKFSIDSNRIDGVKRGDQGAPCSGYVMAMREGNSRRLCAYTANTFFDNAAKRLCYTTGTNFYRSTSTFQSSTRQIMLYSCFSYREQGVDKVGMNSTEYVFELEGERSIGQEFGCEENSAEPSRFDCFDDCHIEGEPEPDVEVGDCANNEPYWAVGCEDINECVNGVYDNCTGPFESSCKIRKACGDNTECVNHVGSYECTCKNGFEGKLGNDLDSYNIYVGCIDIDECDGEHEVCGHYSQCVNTPGSYLCVCPYRENWHKETKKCSGTVCGTPAVDPNAFRPETQGNPGDMVIYTCLAGFTAPDGSDTYTSFCAEGKWQHSGKCRDKNECGTKTCDTNAECFNTNGHFICTCKKGFTGDGLQCERVSCNPLPHIRHASSSIPIPQNPSFGDTIIFTCNQGYQVSIKNVPYNLVSHYGYQTTNSFQVTCDAWGQWEPFPLPHCLPVFCGDPGMVANAERSGAGGLYDQDVWYKCKKGYHPEKNDLGESGFKRTCQADGTWSKGTTCVDTNECEETPLICGVGKYCINIPGSYLCSCVPWYERDTSDARCNKWAGRGTLSDFKPCQILRSIGFCANGECEPVDGYAKCKCDPGYTGAACDQPYFGAKLITALVFLLIVIILMMLEVAYIFYHVVRKTDCEDTPPAVPLPRVYSHPGRPPLPPCPPSRPPPCLPAPPPPCPPPTYGPPHSRRPHPIF